MPSPWPLILAHRGDHRSAHENTVAAFVAARACGADGVEFDVRRIRRGALVLHHDLSRRIRGRRVPLASLTPRQLPSWVPSFDAAMSSLSTWRRAVVDIELKEPGVEERALEYRGPGHVFTSFREDVCRNLRGLDVRAPVGWIRQRPKVTDVEKARDMGCSFLVVHRRAFRPTLLAAARSASLPLWAWGINHAAGYERAARHGIAAVITDRPDRLVKHREAVGSPGTSRRTGRSGN